jgi:flavin-dependent dehydrogenase/ferredoxin
VEKPTRTIILAGAVNPQPFEKERPMPNVIRLDPNLCDGCGLCVRTCPELVYTQEAQRDPAVVNFPERCIGCLACDEDCPRGAIRVHRMPAGMGADEIPAPAAGLDPEKTHDLVVIGAGPAGLAAAIRGRALGLEVAVVERMPSARRSHHPDGGLLSGGSSTYPLERVPGGGLRLRGLDVTLEAGDVRDWMNHFIFMGPDGLATRRSKPGAVEFASVSKDRLVERLADRARDAGATIAWNTRATRIERESAGAMRVTVDGGLALRGRVVIGAEGITGRLAERAGVPLNEFEIGWSYAAVAVFPPLAQPTGEVGFLCDRLAPLPDGPPFLSYWASGAYGTEIATGPIQKGRTRALKDRLTSYVTLAAQREPRLAGRLGGPITGAPIEAPDGCRIFVRRLPRRASGDGLLAVGDALTTCGMLTNLAAARTGDLAAQIARDAIGRGDTSAAALAVYDRKVLRSQRVQGMKWMHGLLIDAPLELPPEKLRALFKVLQGMDLGAMMGGGLGPVLAFFARGAAAGLRRPDLRRYLLG